MRLVATAEPSATALITEPRVAVVGRSRSETACRSASSSTRVPGADRRRLHLGVDGAGIIAEEEVAPLPIQLPARSGLVGVPVPLIDKSALVDRLLDVGVNHRCTSKNELRLRRPGREEQVPGFADAACVRPDEVVMPTCHEGRAGFEEQVHGQLGIETTDDGSGRHELGKGANGKMRAREGLRIPSGP